MDPTIEETLKEQLKDYKNTHFMLVDGMSKLITHQVKKAQSSVFHVAGFKWMLVIYPVRKENSRDYLGFSLQLSDGTSLPSRWEVKCSYKLSILSQTDDVDTLRKTHEVVFKASDDTWGEFTFISHTALKKYIVNDIAIFRAEITEVKPKFRSTSIGRSIATANRLKVMELPRKNSRFTWKITHFSSFDGVEHSSYEFTVGPRRWKLVMFPNGNIDGEGNSLSLYLSASDYVTNAPKEETFAKFTFRVLDQLQGEHYEITTEAWFGYDDSNGLSKVLPLGELHDNRRGFIVNDQIYIGVEFVLIAANEYL